MAQPKINPESLRAYLDASHTQADAARHFGVSNRPTVCSVLTGEGCTSPAVRGSIAGA